VAVAEAVEAAAGVAVEAAATAEAVEAEVFLPLALLIGGASPTVVEAVAVATVAVVVAVLRTLPKSPQHLHQQVLPTKTHHQRG
jgi:hypothetical protein